MTNLAITGTPRAGQTLIATIDTATPGTYAWTGAGVGIGNTYLVDIADAGQTVTAVFTYMDENDRERTEDQSVNIARLDESDDRAFHIDGRWKTGEVLSITDNGSWDDVLARDNFQASAKTYTWLLNGVAIPGATSDTYTVPTVDRHDDTPEVVLRIDYTDSIGRALYVASRPV